MRWFYAISLRLRTFFHRKQAEHDLDDEVSFYLENKIADGIARGLSPEDARREARLALGGLEQLREACRDQRGWIWLEHLAQDLRYAFRTLRKNPGFAAVAILTLALGIGASTALFSLVNTVLIRPLPMERPDRLALIWETAPQVGIAQNNPAPGNFADWKARNHTFADLAAGMSSTFNLTGDGEPARLNGFRITTNFFSTLGIRPALGRFPSVADAASDARLAVIGEGFWRRYYGADPHIIGRTLTLNGEPYTLIGISPRGFQFPIQGVDIWVAAGFGPDELAERGSHYLMVVGRLKDGVSFDQANADIALICRDMQGQYPQTNKGLEAVVLPLREYYAGRLRFALNLLMAAVALLLLIACSNLANLLLTRASARHPEIALRAALGAGRARVVRQLVTESMLLAFMGATVGAFLASGTFRFLARLIPDTFPDGTSISFDPAVWGFTACVSLITGLAFGVGPAFSAARVDLNDILKQGSRSGTAPTARRRVRDLLAVSEVALTIVLLVCAAFMVASYSRVRNVDLGFRAEQLLVLETALPTSKYGASLETRVQFYRDVIQRASQLPGVVSAAYVNFPPLTLRGGANVITIEGQLPGQGQRRGVNNRIATSQYLQTLGVPLLRGRYFDDHDGVNGPRVAVINETMARTYWPGEEALEKRFHVGGRDQPWYTIVGIVGDVKQMGLERSTSPEMYFPVQAAPGGSFFWPSSLVIRASTDPLSLVPSLRDIVFAVDPNQPVANVRTMETILESEASGRETQTIIITAFAVFALLLSAVGLYGVLSFSVTQRRSEIGLRIALGATSREIVIGVLRHAVVVAMAGISIGTAAAYALMRIFSSLLFQVDPADPRVFALMGIALLAVAAVSSFIPARRAAMVDPAVTLKQQ